jgi:hypothetical protein
VTENSPMWVTPQGQIGLNYLQDVLEHICWRQEVCTCFPRSKLMSTIFIGLLIAAAHTSSQIFLESYPGSLPLLLLLGYSLETVYSVGSMVQYFNFCFNPSSHYPVAEGASPDLILPRDSTITRMIGTPKLSILIKAHHSHRTYGTGGKGQPIHIAPSPIR